MDIKACPRSYHQLACVLNKELLMNTDSGEKTEISKVN